MSETKTTNMTVKCFDTRSAMGRQAAQDVAAAIKTLLSQKETINMIFAAAPSQSDFLDSFCSDPEIDFSRINAFHMDEYIGLPDDAPQRFGRFLERELFGRVGFRSVNYVNGSAADPEQECQRYARLLKENPPDIICLGIGENGHIAFNDPGEADFCDTCVVKLVHLDEVCRYQQVRDGCFAQLDDVPHTALTLTIPTLVNADYHFCIVPSEAKAQAVYNTVYGAIDESCPATSLRLCRNVTFYFDKDSAQLL